MNWFNLWQRWFRLGIREHHLTVTEIQDWRRTPRKVCDPCDWRFLRTDQRYICQERPRCSYLVSVCVGGCSPEIPSSPVFPWFMISVWLRSLSNQCLRLHSAPGHQRLHLERFVDLPSVKQFSVLWGEGISLAVTLVSELQLMEFSALLISHSVQPDLQQHDESRQFLEMSLLRKFEWTQDAPGAHFP